MTTIDESPSRSGTTDVAAARRWLATFRRVDHVSVIGSGPTARYVVEGTGHRLPIRRSVPGSVARGMAELGIPLVQRGSR